ncbi:patatin-like phospholipase family protein [Thaumasiovibrio sp. DFM-14]|uniref:patatin-like phospholipase family protein n=1 Tax=Thaumasiovibrio sp. DFM-14 TaxID=3384792 RepID=UPI0039A3D0D4
MLSLSIITPPGIARETIGLVLSGGGAKGAAHIGVLEVLEEQRIPVDVITGTSMGAYVAGMYAMGFSAEEVKQRTLGTNWSEGYHDRVGREALSLQRKAQTDEYQLRTEFGIDLKGNFLAKPSLFQGHAMAKILRNVTDNPPQLANFDLLAIPYRAVATDIESVAPVVLSSGSLPLVMQASMTVPGALKPVEIDGQLLVDGGIVNNMPVDQAIELGATHVIAVDLRDALYARDDLNSGINIANQLITHMTNLGSDQQKALLTPNDVYLQPDLDGLTATSFSSMQDAYLAGRSIALDHLSELLAFQVSEQEYSQYRLAKLDRRSQLLATGDYYIDRIEIVNQTRRSDQALQAVLNLPTGEVLTSAQIEQGVERLYAHDLFDRITYSVQHLEAENVLLLDVNEKVWGPGYLNFKLAIEDDYARRSEYSFGAQYLYTNITDYGGEWLTELDLGSWNRFSTSLYLPWDYQQQIYSRTGISWVNEFRRFGNVDFEELPPEIPTDREYYDTEYSQLYGFIETGWNYSPSIRYSLGLDASQGEYQLEDISISERVRSVGVYSDVVIDTLNNRFFPEYGHYFAVRVGRSHIRAKLEEQNTKDIAHYYDFEVVKPLNWGRHTVAAALQLGGSESDELIPVYARDLGGLFNLSGYNRYELNGRYSALGVIKYRYRLFDVNLGFVQSALYVGGSLERGNVWNQKEAIRWDNTVNAGSIFIGADSILGPTYLGYGMAEDGRSSLYFYLGSQF